MSLTPERGPARTHPVRKRSTRDLSAPGPLALVLGALVLLAGCGDDTPAVPFKHPDRSESGEPGDRSEAQPEASPGLDTEHAKQYPDSPGAVTLEGGEVGREGLHIHASWESVQDRYALLLASDDERKLTLEAAGHRDDGYGQPVSVQRLPLPSVECELEGASLQPISQHHLVASATLTCPPPLAESLLSLEAIEIAGEPPAPDPSDGKEALKQQVFWLLSAGRRPRVLERISLKPPAGETAPRMTLSFESAELDDDEHTDLVARLHLSDASEGGEAHTDAGPEEVRLGFLNRPSGLSPTTDEPESMLLGLADRARDLQKRDPAAAERLAEHVRTTSRRVCRYAQPTELSISGQPGLPCPPSTAVGRATSVLLATAIRRGKPLRALAIEAELDDPQVRLLPVDRKRAERALREIDRIADYQFRRGPTLMPATPPPIHRPRVAFLDEDRLLLRGSPNRTYSLSSGQLSPAGIRSSLAMTSPDGDLAVADIIRACDGYRAQIVRASEIVNGIIAGGELASPLIAPAPPPTGKDCTRMPKGGRHDPGGYVVLDYAPPGLVLANPGEGLLLLRLDARGHPKAPRARAIADSESVPRSRDPMAMARDRRAYPIVTNAGIAIVNGDTTGLLDTGPVRPPFDDVALSPSAMRVAIVQQQTVWVGIRAGAPTPKAPKGPTPTPGAPPDRVEDRAAPPAAGKNADESSASAPIP